MVKFLLHFLPYAFAGGILTSLAEYVFKYNLFTLLEGLLGKLFHKSLPTPPTIK